VIGLSELLSSAGIAAVVSAGLTYLFKPLLEARLQRSLVLRLEELKAAYVAEHEFLRELIKRNSELYPSLIESVYRSRNIARELESRIPSYAPALRAEFGAHALALTEGLYRARLFLPAQLFSPLHEFKRAAQQFVFEYDLLTGPRPSPGVTAALSETVGKLDTLYEEVVRLAQEVLKISTAKVSTQTTGGGDL
jgi:hypothetical protein